MIYLEYYPNRQCPPKGEMGFHKDSLGNTMCVTLTYDNRELPITGPELVVYPSSSTSYTDKMTFIQDIKRQYKKDLVKRMTTLFRPLIPRESTIFFLDPVLAHSSPCHGLFTIGNHDVGVWRKKLDKSGDVELTLEELDRLLGPSKYREYQGLEGDTMPRSFMRSWYMMIPKKDIIEEKIGTMDMFPLESLVNQELTINNIQDLAEITTTLSNIVKNR
jgi:hypothetical protein